jgi:hypothetical protein
MVVCANHSRLSAESGPPQLLETAREREGQRKRERVVPSSNCAWHLASFYISLGIFFLMEVYRGIYLVKARLAHYCFRRLP